MIDTNNETTQPAANADCPQSECSTCLDGVQAPEAFQPQHYWTDGEFDGWINLRTPTISRRIVRSRLAKFKAESPDVKTRVLMIYTRATEIPLPDFL